MFQDSRRKGQLLLEVVLAVAILGIIVGLGAGVLETSFRGSEGASERDIATNLLSEGFDAIKAAAFEKWPNFYYPPSNSSGTTQNIGSGNLYYIKQSDTTNAYSWNQGSSSNWGATTTIRGASASSLRNVWVVGDPVGATENAWKWDGEAWTNYPISGETITFNDVGTIGLNEVWLVGNAGKIYKFDGTTMAAPATDPNFGGNINGISTPASDNIWLVGKDGVGNPKVVSHGVSNDPFWATHTTGAAAGVELFGVSAITDADESNIAKAIVVGASGTVIKYDNSNGWCNYTAGVTASVACNGTGGANPSRWGSIDVKSVSMVSSKDVWIAGANGQVWRGTAATIDGALTWTDYTPASGSRWCNPTCATIRRITAFNASLVYLAGDDGHYWRTADGGANWIDLTPAAGVRWCNSPCTNDLFGLSDRFSTDVWITGVSGQVWNQSSVKFANGPAATTATGSENIITVNGVDYHRYFYIQNVCRDAATREITGSTDTSTCASGTQDASTLKIAATVSWPGGIISSSDYITRWKNAVCIQTEWATLDTSTSAKRCPVTTYDNNTSMTIGTSLTLTAVIFGTVRSNTFDSTSLGYGSAYNSMTWKGSVNSGIVYFKLAASNCLNGSETGSDVTSDCGAAGWLFRGGSSCSSADGTGSTNWWTANPDVPMETSCSQLKDKRYFRYRVRVCANTACTAQTATPPVVDDIIVNYSP